MNEKHKQTPRPITEPTNKPREKWENRPQPAGGGPDRGQTQRDEPRNPSERDPRDEELQTRERERR